MLRNDQMIAQVLANMQDLNNQISRNLNILSNLDRCIPNHTVVQ